MRRIRDGLYLLEAGGAVNAYLIQEAAGWALVDCGPARRASSLLAEMRDGGFHLEEIQRIVLTHAHPDHSGAAAFILSRRLVKVFAHPLDIPALTGNAPPPPYRGFGDRLRGAFFWSSGLEPLARVVAASPQEPLRALPGWQVFHTPGHTDGSLSLYDPVHQVLVCGDALDNRGGRLKPGLGVDAAASRGSIERLASLDVETLCPGHGPVIRERAGLRIQPLAGLQR